MIKMDNSGTGKIIPLKPVGTIPQTSGVYRPTQLENRQMALAANLLEAHKGDIPPYVLQSVLDEMSRGESAEFRNRALPKARMYYNAGPGMFKIFSELYSARAEGRTSALTNIFDNVHDVAERSYNPNVGAEEILSDRSNGIFDRFVREKSVELEAAAKVTHSNKPKTGYVAKALSVFSKLLKAVGISK